MFNMKLTNYTVRDIQGTDYTIEFVFDNGVKLTHTIDLDVITDRAILDSQIKMYAQAYIDGLALENTSIHPDIQALVNKTQPIL